MTDLVFAKHVYKPEEKQYFAFNHPTHQLWRTVDYKDKEKFEQTLKEWFVRTLAYLKESYEYNPSFKIWSAWREERLKYQGLRKKLPELEGIF